MKYKRWILTHAVENLHPSFHGDALEHSQYRKQDIVEVGNAKVGSSPVFSALSVIGTQPGRRFHTTRPISGDLT